MGTNYYWYPDESCSKCGRNDDSFHIGKSSAGWCFSLHVNHEQGFGSLQDWMRIWKKGEIKDEYGEKISATKMLEIIRDRQGNSDFNKPMPESRFYQTRDWNEFFEQNHAQRGPRNLLRHRINQQHCIGHGKGTWDLCIGEFS